MQRIGDGGDEIIMRIDIFLRFGFLLQPLLFDAPAILGGLGFEPHLLNGIGLEGADRIRHVADFIAFAHVRNVDAGVAVRQCLHAAVENADREGDALRELMAGIDRDRERKDAADDLREMDEPHGAHFCRARGRGPIAEFVRAWAAAP